MLNLIGMPDQANQNGGHNEVITFNHTAKMTNQSKQLGELVAIRFELKCFQGKGNNDQGNSVSFYKDFSRQRGGENERYK